MESVGSFFQTKSKTEVVPAAIRTTTYLSRRWQDFNFNILAIPAWIIQNFSFHRVLAGNIFLHKVFSSVNCFSSLSQVSSTEELGNLSLHNFLLHHNALKLNLYLLLCCI